MSLAKRTFAYLVVQSLLTVAVLNVEVVAQRPPDMKLDPTINRQVVEGAIRAVNKYYVSAEVAKQVELNLRERLKNVLKPSLTL